MSNKALALLLLCLIVAISLPFIKAQSTMHNGVLAHEMTEGQAQLLTNSNITWLSADVTVGNLPTSWTNIYNLSKQYDLNLIGILDTVTMNNNQTFTLQDWNQTVLQAVSQYGDKVNVWKIWNEPTYTPNQIGYFENGSPQNYVDMLKIAYQDIKSAYPNEIVLGLGGVPLFTSTEPSPDNTYVMQALDWTQQVVDLGGMQYCDAIALHAYPYHPYDSTVEAAFTNSLAQYGSLTGKDVWITEVGLPSNDTSQNDQSYFLNQSYNLLKQQGIEAYIWYELNDNPTRSGDPPYFGLFDESLTPKTTFGIYTDLVKATPTPPPSPTPPPPTPELLILVVIALICTAMFCIIGLRKHIISFHGFCGL